MLVGRNEGILEGILGVGFVSEQTLGGLKHAGAEFPDDGLEGGRIARSKAIENPDFGVGGLDFGGGGAGSDEGWHGGVLEKGDKQSAPHGADASTSKAQEHAKRSEKD